MTHYEYLVIEQGRFEQVEVYAGSDIMEALENLDQGMTLYRSSSAWSTPAEWTVNGRHWHAV